MEQTFTLSQPVQHGTEELMELTLREPTPKDVGALGLPYRLHADLTSEPVPAVCTKYISRLAGIPTSVVEKLAPTTTRCFCILSSLFFHPLAKNRRGADESRV